MNENDKREDEQAKFPQEPSDSPVEASASDEIEVVDVQLGSGTESPQASVANDDEIDTPGTEQPGDASETASPDPEAAEAQIPTQPILDQNGNMPRTIEALMIALAQWQEAAAAAQPDDPRFMLHPTNKSRQELLETGGAPWQPAIWVDRETMTPVKYEESQLGPPPAAEEWRQRPKVHPAHAAVEEQQRLGTSRTPLLITLARADRHFIDALDARVPYIQARVLELIKQEIEREQRRQFCLDRAILGGR